MVSASTALAAVLLTASPNPLSEEALVRDVKNVNAAADHRRTHVDPPVPGTFAALAAPYFERLAPLAKGQLGEPMKALGEYSRGERSWDSLPEDLRERFKKSHSDAEALMRACRASSGQLPLGFTALSHVTDPVPEATVFAAKVVAAQIRRILDANPSEAVALCVDAVGFARDLSYGTALGRMLSVAAIRIVAPTCEAALSREPPSATACSALHSVAENTAPLSVMFAQEKIWAELNFFGDPLSASTVAQLPPEAKRVVALPRPASPFSEPVRFEGVRRRLFGSWARRDFVARRNALEAVADAPPSEADPVVSRLQEEDTFFSFKLVGFPLESSTSWLKFMKRWRDAQETLNGLALHCDEARAGTDVQKREGTGG